MDIENSNFGSANGTTTRDVSVSVDQPLWRGGRTTAEIKQAKMRILAGQARLKSTEQEILYSTLESYIRVVRNQKLYNLRGEYVSILEKEYQVALDKKEIGVFTITDVRQAQARLSRAKSSYIQARNLYDLSKYDFTQISGLEMNGEFDFPDSNFEFPTTVKSATDQALINNPAAIAIQHDIEAAGYGLNAVERELYPQISAFGSVNKQYDPQPGIVDDTQANTIGVRANLALYERGTIRSRIRQEGHEIEYQRYQYDQVVQEIRQDILRDITSYNSSVDLVKRRENEIQSTYEAVQGVREEVQLGQRTLLDILDADEEMVEAKVELINALSERILSQLSFSRTLGLLDAKNISRIFADS